LYLPLIHFDKYGIQNKLGGLSALRFIANAIQGKPLMRRAYCEPRSEPPFGYDDPAHPLEKLSRLGGIVGRRQVFGQPVLRPILFR
jgi:hypothetical protein